MPILPLIKPVFSFRTLMEAAIGSVKSYSGSLSYFLIGANRFSLSIEPYPVDIWNLYLELDVYLSKLDLPLLSLLLFLLLNRLSFPFFSLKLALCYMTSYIYCLVTFTTDIFIGEAADRCFVLVRVLEVGVTVGCVSTTCGRSVWVSWAAITFPACLLMSEMTYICSLVGILKFLRFKFCESKFCSHELIKETSLISTVLSVSTLKSNFSSYLLLSFKSSCFSSYTYFSS